jgi:hypothetical protein
VVEAMAVPISPALATLKPQSATRVLALEAVAWLRMTTDIAAVNWTPCLADSMTFLLCENERYSGSEQERVSHAAD